MAVEEQTNIIAKWGVTSGAEHKDVRGLCVVQALLWFLVLVNEGRDFLWSKQQ